MAGHFLSPKMCDETQNVRGELTSEEECYLVKGGSGLTNTLGTYSSVYTENEAEQKLAEWKKARPENTTWELVRQTTQIYQDVILIVSRRP